MALEIAAVQRDLPRDFVEAYRDRTGEIPLSVIRRETLIVEGMMPRASACEVFLAEGVRLGEDEWKKVIYKPGKSTIDEEDFADFARGYTHTVRPERVLSGRRFAKEYHLLGDVVSFQGRPYINASIRGNAITRMELGFQREEPAFEVLDGTEKENVTFRTRREFWQKKIPL